MKLSSIILISVLTFSGHVQAGDVAAGQSSFAAKGCIGCHGSGGVSMVPAYPSLKGRSEEFVLENLTNFRSGQRQNPTMNAMAAGLSDADIENLAAYIGSL